MKQHLQQDRLFEACFEAGSVEGIDSLGRVYWLRARQLTKKRANTPAYRVGSSSATRSSGSTRRGELMDKK